MGIRVSTELAHGRLAGLDEISTVGVDAQRGGYSRHLWQPADMELRGWFIDRATRLGLEVETDRNGNLWAWWGSPGPDAVVTGSHLDSVPGGGEYDGPLGVVSALDAVARLKATGFVPARPVAILVFAEEEGSRFGVACLGSRLMTGAIDADTARGLTDSAGISLADAATAAGLDAAKLGADPVALARIGVFIELHIEQGRGLIDRHSAIALAGSILSHGRWQIDFTGQGNHAGATTMQHRRDPMIAAALAVIAVRDAALASPGSRATVGRLFAVPGGSNVIASSVAVSLDARAGSGEQTLALVADIRNRVADIATASGCLGSVSEQSWGDLVTFDAELNGTLSGTLGGIPILQSGAGHDAGILAARVPSAMLFVRNPTGISHAPQEFAEADDTLAGVSALEQLLRSLLSSVAP